VSLADRLSALTVSVLDAAVEVKQVIVPRYEGLRPTSVLRVRGRDRSVGVGEHVGWSTAAHEAFRERVAALDWPEAPVTIAELSTRVDLGDDTSAEDTRHRRAAFDAALLDLALQQAQTSLAQLAGAPAVAAMHYLISFEAMSAPADRVRAIRAFNPTARFKIDVDPAWAASEIAELGALECVDVLDGKGRGDAALWQKLRAAFPLALFEDAGAASTALDQSLVSLDDVVVALDAGHSVNVKAPRLGGFLVAIRALELAAQRGRTAYVGGMYEVGPGRTQARCLAALLSPSGPNDLAPLGVDPARAAIESSPLSIALATSGFGAVTR
jgi:L-alanine-DL-glutamate epimerase-like enolase superfamily enzyme